MELEPVLDTPALHMRGSHNWVCVADLHLGIESQLRHAGFNIPSQTPRMLSALVTLAAHGDRLLILGDVKHRIPTVSYREDRDIPPLMARLLDAYKEVAIVAGNHDGSLSSVLPPGVKAYSSHGTRIEDVGAFHGHVWPSAEAMSGEKLLMAHIHPAVVLTDSLGSRTNEKCWVRAKLKKAKALERYDSCPKELVIVPAFNPLLTGTPVNTATGTTFGPLFRNELVNRRSMRVYLLDGSNLGYPKRV